MAVTLQIPIFIAITEVNAPCVLGAEFKDGKAIISFDLRRERHRQILGLGTKTKLHWSEIRSYVVQEISSFPWPIEYHVTTADAWYSDDQGNRVHYSPRVLALDPHAKVSDAAKRATAVLLVVFGAIGYRRAAWLLWELFRINASKSSLARWFKDVASLLPS